MKEKFIEFRKGDPGYTEDKEKRIFVEKEFNDKEKKEMESIEEKFIELKEMERKHSDQLYKLEIFSDGTYQIRSCGPEPENLKEDKDRGGWNWGQLDRDWTVSAGGKLIEEEIE